MFLLYYSFRILFIFKLHDIVLKIIYCSFVKIIIKLVVYIIGDIHQADLSNKDFAGILLQYPDTTGDIQNFESVVKEAKKNNVRKVFKTKN